MTVRELNEKTDKLMTDTRDVFQTIYDSLNLIPGLTDRLLNIESVKEIFDRYGVIYE